jgi:diguanylate cyclase (GGDEF)-like protein
VSELASLFAQSGIQPYLNHTQTLIVLIDPDGRLLEWNPAFGQMKKAHPGAAAIQDILAAPSQSLFAELIQTKEPRQASLELSSFPKGYSFKCLLAPVPGGGFLFFAEPAWKSWNKKLAHLTNDIKKAKHDLKIRKIDLESVLIQANEIAHTDSLTFLPNRRQIIADLQRQVALCDRHRKPLTIFMLDIDHFKQVNDSFGHIAGDRVLRALADRLLESIREVDEAGRYGGDEFIILLPGTAEKSARKMANRVLGLVRGLEIRVDEHVLKITVSIGIAEYRIGEESWDELLKRADQALYQSKENSRNRWTLSQKEMAGQKAKVIK